ncbi:MAG TPA: TPM domain-containing protein [Caulobacteraceae bacterium]|jgi:putative membrane protein
MLIHADHDRIAAAVGEAESKTSGEILCVLQHKVSDYREVPLAWAAGCALIIPALLAAFGVEPWLASANGGDWVATNAVSLGLALNSAIIGYSLIQLGIFTVVAAALAIFRPLKLALTPKGLKRRRVRRAALHHLQAAHLVCDEGVVVIFASDQERMVTVVADEALHLKAGEAAWDGAVAAVLSGIKAGDATSGFVAAVELCGGYLAEHFPQTGPKRNSLSDGLLEI